MIFEKLMFILLVFTCLCLVLLLSWKKVSKKRIFVIFNIIRALFVWNLSRNFVLLLVATPRKTIFFQFGPWTMDYATLTRAKQVITFMINSCVRSCNITLICILEMLDFHFLCWIKTIEFMMKNLVEKSKWNWI